MARLGHASVTVGIAPEEVVKFAPGNILAGSSSSQAMHSRPSLAEWSSTMRLFEFRHEGLSLRLRAYDG